MYWHLLPSFLSWKHHPFLCHQLHLRVCVCVFLWVSVSLRKLAASDTAWTMLFLTQLELHFLYKAMCYPGLNRLPPRQRPCLYLYSKSALLILHRRRRRGKKGQNRGQAVNSRLSEPGATMRSPVLVLPFWPLLFFFFGQIKAEPWGVERAHTALPFVLTTVWKACLMEANCTPTAVYMQRSCQAGRLVNCSLTRDNTVPTKGNLSTFRSSPRGQSCSYNGCNCLGLALPSKCIAQGFTLNDKTSKWFKSTIRTRSAGPVFIQSLSL